MEVQPSAATPIAARRPTPQSQQHAADALFRARDGGSGPQHPPGGAQHRWAQQRAIHSGKKERTTRPATAANGIAAFATSLPYAVAAVESSSVAAVSSPSSDVVKSATAEDMAAPSDSSRAALESGDAVELEAAGSAAQREAKSARRVVRSDMRIANARRRGQRR